MSSVQKTLRKDFYVHLGAPEPIIVRLRAGGTNGTLVAFDNSLKFMYTVPSGSVVLGVGSGITLSTDESIANARATIQLTVAQSRDVPLGAVTQYELQRTVNGDERVFLMGNLIGEGGINPDG